MRSTVHPKYKTKYRVGNWSAYEQPLVQRGDVTLWLSADATDAWRPSPSGRPGAPKTFSDCAIETALTLRLVFRVPLRQAEGFLRSVLSLMGVDLAAPDHTTLSRRSQSLAVECRRIPSRGPIHLIVDSTGRSIVGEGEWAAVQHGGRGHRGGKTLHLAGDRVGVIVAHALTEPTVDAATIGIDLIETVDDEIARVTADAAYETVAFYEAAEMRDATVVVPPSKTARVSRRRPRSRARDRTITDVRTLGRRRWKQEAGYQLQARVENAFFRYKSILGDRLRARSRGGRVAESVVACNVLNQMTELGRPESYSSGRRLASGLGSLTVSFESCTSAAPRWDSTSTGLGNINFGPACTDYCARRREPIFQPACNWPTRMTYTRHRIRHRTRHTAARTGRRPCPCIANERLRYMLIDSFDLLRR